MTSIDPVPLNPADIGRDNDIDGTLGTSVYLSEVKVINITPHEVNEIKTSVITLEQDAFPVPRYPGDPSTTPISVFADDVERGYVQWEPMGDLYPSSTDSPLGSYKYLRVKWDCYLPAGTDNANYTFNGAIEGPYQYYREKTYTFRSIEPISSPNFTLTNGVLSALGYLGSDKATHFEFSAHGYVNKFNFFNGLYGQDKQTAFPDGSSLLPAERDVIYDRFFREIGNITEAPNATIECLAKEYTVRGRIVPELDYDGAAFEVIQQGNTIPGTETSSIFSTSGRDAPPLWYNFNYELQHNKNIIPFSFIWGTSILTYDHGTYDPRGAEVDLQDRFGRVTGTPKNSSNNGPRLRSQDWVDYFDQYNPNEARCPNIFHSQEDITFSVVGPDVVCHASSVNVCAVYSEITPENQNKTIINWFDKRNQTWYDIEVFGFNWLPSESAWVLRGCLHINENYLPSVSLSTRDRNAQLSNKLEKTWAIDQNFYDRKLFTVYKNTHYRPPQELLQIKGYTNYYQTAAKLAVEAWETDISISATHLPRGITENNNSNNPYFGQPIFEAKTTKLLKGLHDPWAMNPIGLNMRAGVPAEQPGFNFIGVAGILAAAGLPDARFIEVCMDLEWQRVTIEVERDGRIVDQFGPQWSTKRQTGEFSNLSLPALNDYVAQTDPTYTGWLNKTIDSPEFVGSRKLLENDSILGYVGSAPAMRGDSSICKFRRGYDNALYGKGNGKTNSYSSMGNTFRGSRVTYRNISHPAPKYQNAYGYPDPATSHFFAGDTYSGFTFSHSAYGNQMSYGLISGDKVMLTLIDHYIRVVMISHNDGEHARLLFDNDQQNYRVYRGDAGRNEGRPLHGLIAGIGITRDRKLAERALCNLSRRFWNQYHVQNFEHSPTGVPGKPWVSIWYPPWGAGKDLALDSQGIPYEFQVGSVLSRNVTELFEKYIGQYGYQGDLALRLYNTAGLRIRELNPNFVSSNAASWDWNSAGGVVDYTWVDKYAGLERSNGFTAPGLSSIDRIPGGPAVRANVKYRLKYRYTDSNDPFATTIYDPPLGFDPSQNRGAGNYISALPEVTGISPSATLQEVRSNMATRYTTQAYQQTLLFPYISPLAELFSNYAGIFRSRANLGKQLNFIAKFDDYATLASELTDTGIKFKEYLVRVAKSIAKNTLLKIDENSQIAGGLYGVGYSYSPYSPNRLYENFSDSERYIILDSEGQGELPVIGSMLYTDYSDPENPVLKSYDTRLIKESRCGAGAYLQATDYSTFSKGLLGGAPYGTALWTAGSFPWAWEVIYKYGDLNNSDNLEVLERLKIAIEGWFGFEAFNIDNWNSNDLFRSQFYKRFWANYGWPTFGIAPNRAMNDNYADPEVMPWLAGVAEDIWRNKELNTTIKILDATRISGQTSPDTTIDLISADRRTYTYELQPSGLLNPGKGIYPFFRQTNQKNALPRTIEAVRDIGMSSLYVNGGETNQFDFTLLEDQLNAISSNHCQANVRIHIDYPRQLDVVEEPGQPRRYIIRYPDGQDYRLPKFLRTEFGGPVQSYPYLTRVNTANGVADPNIPFSIGVATSGYIPDYDNPQLINECVRLITELGRVYDNDPRIIEFQVGFGGHWGEWNQYAAWARPELDANNNPIFPVRWGKNPPASFLSTLCYAFDNAFKKTFITGRYLDGRNNDRALPDTPVDGIVSQNTRVGLHDDSLGWNSINEPTKPWYTETQINHYNWGNKYTKAYIGGETRPELARDGDAYNTTFSGTYSVTPQNLLECIRRLKISSISEAIGFGYFYSQRNTQEQYDNIIRQIHLLGYSLFIQNAIIPTEIALGENFDITVNIKNTGVAPFYQNWPLVVRFQNATQSYEIETAANLSSILPDTSVDITQAIDGIALQTALSLGGSTSAYVYIKKPAAFLRDVTFMNAEHIDSSPYMNLGQLTLTVGPTKYISGDIQNEIQLSGEVKAITTKSRTPKDHGNESYYPKLQGPQITNIPGGAGGPSTKTITGLVAGVLTPNVATINLDRFIDALLSLETFISATVEPTNKISGLLELSTQLESDYEMLSSEIALSNLAFSGALSLESDTFDVFIALPDFNFSGSTEIIVDNLPVIIPTTFTVEGSTNLFASSNIDFTLENLLISGSSDLNLDQIYDTAFDGELEGSTVLDGDVYVSAGSLRGLAAPRPFSLELSETSFSRSDYAEEINKIDSYYTGLKSRQKQNFEVSLYRELVTRSFGDSEVTEVYKDTLKFLISKFSEFVYINDENKVVTIPCWHGNSERVVAKAKQESNIILPVISIYRSGNKVDEQRRRSSSLIVYEKYWNKEKQRAVRVASIAPAPINISYKINVWTKYQEDMDHVTEQIHRLFNPDLEISTRYNSTTKAFMLEESESAEVNFVEGTDRVIRKMFTIDVQSYIPNPKFLITNTGKIETFNAEVCIPIK